MLGLVLLFFFLALISGLLGFTSLMVASAHIAQILFIIFLILFAFSLVLFILKKMQLTIAESLQGGTSLLAWVLTFFVIALIAGLLGFTGVMAATAGIAKILFVIFIVLFVVSVIMHFIRKSPR